MLNRHCPPLELGHDVPVTEIQFARKIPREMRRDQTLIKTALVPPKRGNRPTRKFQTRFKYHAAGREIRCRFGPCYLSQRRKVLGDHPC